MVPMVKSPNSKVVPSHGILFLTNAGFPWLLELLTMGTIHSQDQVLDRALGSGCMCGAAETETPLRYGDTCSQLHMRYSQD